MDSFQLSIWWVLGAFIPLTFLLYQLVGASFYKQPWRFLLAGLFVLSGGGLLGEHVASQKDALQRADSFAKSLTAQAYVRQLERDNRLLQLFFAAIGGGLLVLAFQFRSQHEADKELANKSERLKIFFESDDARKMEIKAASKVRSDLFKIVLGESDQARELRERELKVVSDKLEVLLNVRMDEYLSIRDSLTPEDLSKLRKQI